MTGRPPDGYRQDGSPWWRNPPAPFEAGNKAAEKDGVYSRFVASVSELEQVTQLFGPSDWAARYPAMSLVAAEVWVRWQRAEAAVRRDGLVRADGSPHPLLPELGRLSRQLLDISARFGLDPRSDADLKRSQAEAVSSAFDLEAVMARGREARLRAQEASLSSGTGEAVDSREIEARGGSDEGAGDG